MTTDGHNGFESTKLKNINLDEPFASTGKWDRTTVFLLFGIVEIAFGQEMKELLKIF